MAEPRAIASIVLLGGTVLSCYESPYPRELILHHIATLAGIGAMYWLAGRYSLSNGAVARIAIFLSLHILGARYIYSFVPYSDWSQAVSGISIDEMCDFHRNHYDRFVHFAFGVLLARPAREILTDWGPLSSRQLSIAVLMAIISTSFLYEILEWSIALVFAPDYAESFNGQQGDIWDAHKDMALATCGAILAIVFRYLPRSACRRALVGRFDNGSPKIPESGRPWA